MSKVLVDRELLEKHISEIDSWNASMEKIIGKQPDYRWASLETLREALAQPAEAEGVERHRMVESMCLTWRHDFGLDKPEGCALSSGMTVAEREHLRGQMAKLFDHHFGPALSAVTAERDRLESMLVKTATRHFARQIKDRADGKRLDECLSEGIAMLEAERDRLDAECGRLLEGKIQDAETIYILEAERDQLRAEVGALREENQRLKDGALEDLRLRTSVLELMNAANSERDRLREQCEINDLVHGTKGRERVAALLAQNEELRKDATRLDWLDEYIVIAEHEDTGKFAFNSIKGALRECVDAAMAAREA